MRFLWPEMLWLLLALPLLAGAYIYLLVRRKKNAVRYPSLALARSALGPRQRLRRHVPPALFLLGLAAALLACARPSATVTLPADTLTVILAMDVSRSMEAADVPPTRLSAAQQAARNFVADLPPSVRLGIVAFAASAAVVQPPTDNRQDTLDAIDRFELQRGTATGSGLIVALGTLFPEDRADLEALLLNDPSSRFGAPAAALGNAGQADAARKREQERPSVQPGSYRNGAIILLSDGRRTTGPDPLDVARMAAKRGVRIYTVGFGTRQGGVPPGEEGWSYFMQLDETTLRAVAKLTGGEYFQAGSAGDLSQVYRNLSTRFSLERRNTEIGGLLAALAAVLIAAASILSALWFRR
ncbi:VWA domain-containing protein [Bordetella genomosp. 9]|uniref:ABC transporter ATP-binding protein n=1 Tax=Bordetella genomosp. 9 TaxID=1416803 RepID=A0A1W6YZW0_9BORD|nr:VWA domain-containing protein [Bordetella genomosp. 9]ARP86531.1 ABC transporter ATP-binding protein [Bordetella genomosp. 9]ARP90545.1 ABC transporter ATP-binding protein [Bordetella genomosp. 9]